MSTQTPIDVGAAPDDGTGDSLRAGGIVINDNMALVDARITGFMAYGDAIGATALTGGVWADIPNDTLGFGNVLFPPTGITSFMDPLTGYLDMSETDNGDAVIVRSQFAINPGTNNQELHFRVTGGTGGNAFILERQLSKMGSGSGVDYKQVVTSEIAMFNDDTRTTPIKLQVQTSGSSTLTNVGVLVQGLMRAENA